MKFERVIRAVYFQPWLIEPSTHASIRRLLDSRLSGEIAQKAADIAPSDDSEEEDQIQNGVQIIQIHGVIGQRLSFFDKVCTGACDVLDVEESIRGAVNDTNVQKILLHVDSPGGTVGGVAELADTILQARSVKPVMVFTDGLMCSAAYWLGCCATAIYATKTAEVGSIGVYIPWVDETKAFEKAGFQADPIINTGGDFKAVGFPGTSLTKEQRADLQSKVDQTFSMFRDHVVACRPGVSMEALNGKTFMGAQAQKMGLVDQIATMDQAFQDILNPSFS